MSFATIYVVMPDDGSLISNVALSTSPDAAQQELRWGPSGGLYAIKVSETTANEIINEVKAGRYEKAALLAKRYSTAIQRCGDV